ncbi:hypothetical protein BGZ57DRAFT_595670 [Hyaloscypha finlandica]|nr:hypothetical protein BGZ57DRAFT_595670 [Hyaloscypha finlandica]
MCLSLIAMWNHADLVTSSAALVAAKITRTRADRRLIGPQLYLGLHRDSLTSVSYQHHNTETTLSSVSAVQSGRGTTSGCSLSLP